MPIIFSKFIKLNLSFISLLSRFFYPLISPSPPHQRWERKEKPQFFQPLVSSPPPPMVRKKISFKKKKNEKYAMELNFFFQGWWVGKWAGWVGKVGWAFLPHVTGKLDFFILFFIHHSIWCFPFEDLLSICF